MEKSSLSPRTAGTDANSKDIYSFGAIGDRKGANNTDPEDTLMFNDPPSIMLFADAFGVPSNVVFPL
jgi:hypothetical protein